jgi:hypothetical protein
MFKKNRFLIVGCILVVGIISITSLGMAAGGSQDQYAIEKFCQQNNQDPLKIANEYLDTMQKAYETENLPLFLRLYNDPFVAVDAVEDSNDLYTIERTKDEVGQMFDGFSGIKCVFADRQITFEGDMIMVRTMRSFTANEFPMVAKCDMVMVLRKSYTQREFWKFIATDQLLLHEEYVPLPGQATGNSLNKLAGPAVKTQQPPENHLFW